MSSAGFGGILTRTHNATAMVLTHIPALSAQPKFQNELIKVTQVQPEAPIARTYNIGECLLRTSILSLTEHNLEH